MSSERIQTTMHSTALKFGHEPDPTKPQWKDRLQDTTVAMLATKMGLETVGVDLTYAQDRALHAVQVLFDNTKYKGNDPSHKPKNGGKYKFTGHLPVLVIKTAEYLRVYGVKETITHRGKEFSSQGEKVAKKALRDLRDDKYLIVYKKRNSKNSRKIDHVEDIAALLTLDIQNGGRQLRIVPNAILVDQLDSYCLLKPRDFFDLVPGKDIVAARFLEFVLYHAEMDRKRKKPTGEIRMQPEVMAWQMRLESMIKARKKTALRNKLNKLYDLGVTVGYLVSYQIDHPGTKGRVVDILKLNNQVPVGAKSISK